MSICSAQVKLFYLPSGLSHRAHGFPSGTRPHYARLYGLSRDELRYVLDPQAVDGSDFPGEAFRVRGDYLVLIAVP
jgi:hypothetical protein